MPPDREITFLKREDLLTYEEIREVVDMLTEVGVKKVRITGGEPLVRTHIENLIKMISSMKQIKDIALTTNGYLLSKKVGDLKSAGLMRITISLPTLREDKFASIVGKNLSLREVLEGIKSAKEVGFKSVKINTTVVRNVNDDEILDLAEFCRKHDLILRFIEYMDVGTLNSWQREKVVSAEEILEKLRQKYKLEEIEREHKSETALKFRYTDTGQEIGIIASVTKPFCRNCNRLRLSAEGKLYPCLFSNKGLDIKSLIRNSVGRDYILQIVKSFWEEREDRYSEIREIISSKNTHRVEMFRVGG